MPTIYGDEVDGVGVTGRTGVIGEVDKSASGNLILRAGHTLGDAGWEQTEHIVLTPAEGLLLVLEITSALWGPDGPVFLPLDREAELPTVAEAISLYAESFSAYGQGVPPEVPGLLARIQKAVGQ